jgi:hypothetical protein
MRGDGGVSRGPSLRLEPPLDALACMTEYARAGPALSSSATQNIQLVAVAQGRYTQSLDPGCEGRAPDDMHGRRVSLAHTSWLWTSLSGLPRSDWQTGRCSPKEKLGSASGERKRSTGHPKTERRCVREKQHGKKRESPCAAT